MKVVVTGAKGQLGRDLVRRLRVNRGGVFGYGREELDITRMESVRQVIDEIRPDVIIHAAAYTKVDQAESDEEQAYLVNAFGSRNVAIAAEEFGAKLCYISTDYVFDGKATFPYKEYDRTNPLGVYGKSKYAGEELTKTLSSKYFIVRTSWVYGVHGHNFVRTMLRLAEERDELKVVNDQIGSPTYTVDLAEFIAQLIATEKYGIYHASNTGTCSWYDFAKAIFEEAGVQVKVSPIATEDFPRPAPRPKYSVLDHLAIRANGFQDLRHWREGLKDFLKELGSVRD
ncbi:dTDP-4-dehydrorhamnose reductase [Microaerobacter geothermalis]|uniref:dTDP-4-dehydrorhamnose reductase n=1 Tax=Microaerobacter geothermalis TaxID=674972 RepID=UPI001F3AA4C6|nr:dTDP-4-dehydrorhamnose reductase [Microaerobacter geothermalis]MCF6093268.1 dTDP-4-dehydrorhamnose reductase [Microaerobacter geothermalis]